MGVHPLDSMRDQIVTQPFPLGNRNDGDLQIGQTGVDLSALPSKHN